MKKSFSVMVAIVLIASMSLLAFAACVTDDECRHSAMQCIDAVDATCIENGNIEYWYCPDCGKYYSDEMGEHAISIDDTVIAATGEHDWGAWVTDSESSCTTGGTRHRICNDCGERQDDALPVGEHDLNFVKAVEATCTEEGNVAHWHCSECGKNYSDEEATEVLNDVTTPKAAHDTTFVEAQAHTCTEDGNIAYWHCGACGHNFADEDGEQELESVADPAAHAWGEWEQTSDPTCTERGVLTRVCEVCFDEEYDYIDELGHDFEDSEWKYDEINHWQICSRCEAVSEKEEHKWEEWQQTVEPTCAHVGLESRFCSICMKEQSNEMPALEHDFKDAEWGHDSSGHWEICNRCGAESERANHEFNRGVCFCGALAPTETSEFCFVPLDNGTMKLAYYRGDDASVVIPTVYQGKSVTEISENAFIDKRELQTIVIPSSINVIGEYAFAGCSALIDVTIEKGVETIESCAFESCSSLTNIDIPDGVTYIGSSAFSGCNKLESITIPFVGDSKKTAEDTYQYPFGYIFGATSYSGGNATEQYYYGSSATSTTSTTYYIPTSLKSVTVTGGDILRGAFGYCSDLTNVTIGDGVTGIGGYAFSGCSGLTSIAIPDSVTNIGNDVFDDCSGLTDVYYQGDLSGWLKFEFESITSNPMYYADNLYVGGELLQGDIVVPVDSFFIRPYSFMGCRNLTSVTIPDGVTSIGERAFSICSGLTSVTIPDSVRSIGDYAFSGCSGLTSITIPDSVTSIGNSAFYNCDGLTSVTIPDSVTSIGYEAFMSCSGLTSVTIGDGVTSIGEDAFYDCDGLTSVTIPDSVTSIGKGAFEYCDGLTNITIPFVGQKADGTGATHFGYIFGASDYSNNKYDVPSSLKEVVITGGTGIDDRAFDGCGNLTSIILPEHMVSISNNAFYNCNAVEVIDGISYVGKYVIDCSTSVVNAVIRENTVCIIETAFEGCNQLKSVTIPDSVTYIGSSAFSGCSKLESITIPFVGESRKTAEDTYQYPFGYIFGTTSYSEGSATKQYYYGSSATSTTSTTYYIPTSLKSVTVTGGDILRGAFYDCDGLTSVTIGDGVTSIGHEAFYSCSSLTSVTIGNGVTSIDTSAFSSCSDLTSITIPDSVTSIGGGAFSGCSSLQFNEYGGAKYLGNEANPYAVLYDVTDTSVTSFEIMAQTKIINGAFSGCNSLTSITIPDGVTSIDNRAFSGCSGLTSIVIPDSVTSIGEYAFSGCSGLTSVTIGNGVTSIGEFAFENCSGLTSIIIPGSVTSIGRWAFYGCSGLTSITIPFVGERADGTGATYFGYIFGASRYLDNGSYVPKTLKEVIITGGTSITGHGFSGCSSLTSIKIPDSVTSIGEYAFGYCIGLTSVTIPGSVTSIGEYAFGDCSGLTSVTIPGSVTSIGEYAFDDCSGLTSVTIGEGVKSIGKYAFNDCGGLTDVYYQGDLSGWSEIEFGDNYAIPMYYADNLYINGELLQGDIVIPDGTEKIGAFAFSYCNGLTSVVIPDSVTSIGGYAFSDCSGLASVTIGDGVTSIGWGAFSDCSGLTSVTIGNGVTSIGGYAFSGCSGLTSVTIGNNVTSIGNYAFSGCSGLTNIVIPDSVTSIGDSAFTGCSGLTSVTIPDSVTSIGGYAFSSCDGLTSMTILTVKVGISSTACKWCSNLEYIYYSGSMEEWKQSAGGWESSNADQYQKVYCTDGIIRY